MSATNKTENYELPIYEANDKPTYLGDWNGTMNKLDSAIHDASESGGSADALLEDIGITDETSALDFKQKVDDAQNASQVNAAIEAKGYQTETQVDEKISARAGTTDSVIDRANFLVAGYDVQIGEQAPSTYGVLYDASGNEVERHAVDWNNGVIDDNLVYYNDNGTMTFAPYNSMGTLRFNYFRNNGYTDKIPANSRIIFYMRSEVIVWEGSILSEGVSSQVVLNSGQVDNYKVNKISTVDAADTTNYNVNNVNITYSGGRELFTGIKAKAYNGTNLLSANLVAANHPSLRSTSSYIATSQGWYYPSGQTSFPSWYGAIVIRVPVECLYVDIECGYYGLLNKAAS